MTEAGKTMAIFGATSAIAQETARILAAEGWQFVLCARNQERLERLSRDLKVRGAQSTESVVFDALDAASIREAVTACVRTFPRLDVLLIAHGWLPEEADNEQHLETVHRCFQINFLSVAAIIGQILKEYANTPPHTIAVISSVAGERGRARNFLYGAGKAALTAYLSGLRQKYAGRGIHILTIKPGFVDTPMTDHLDKNPLFASPKTVAKSICRAIERKKDILFVPWFWRPIMGVVRLLPENLFKRLSI